MVVTNQVTTCGLSIFILDQVILNHAISVGLWPITIHLDCGKYKPRYFCGLITNISIIFVVVFIKNLILCGIASIIVYFACGYYKSRYFIWMYS